MTSPASGSAGTATSGRLGAVSGCAADGAGRFTGASVGMANGVGLGATEAGATGLMLGAGSVGAGNPGALFILGHRHVWAVA